MVKSSNEKEYARPTTALKHKIVLEKMSENGGNAGKALRDSGYSTSYSKTPQKLLRSKTWQEVTEEFFPDAEIAKKHRQLLEKKEVIVHGKDSKLIKTGEIDVNAVARGLDMVYKIKNRYKETIAVEVGKYRNLTDAELAGRIAQSKRFFMKK
ncbi:MAG: hypothetical protein JWM20_598 [Patescibacteria group bacterium]|nr:hypothetical protein [Patescibacteria group bacterium]